MSFTLYQVLAVKLDFHGGERDSSSGGSPHRGMSLDVRPPRGHACGPSLQISRIE
jgi:hypothetical protein